MSEAGKRSGRGTSKREAQAEREEGRAEEPPHDEAWREKLERDPEFASRVLRTLDGLVPGAIKRAAVSGMGNILQGEDGAARLARRQQEVAQGGRRVARLPGRLAAP